MRLVPESNVGKIQFYSSRFGPWAERAAEIGADPALVATLAGQTEAARAAYKAQRAAQQAAQAATITMNLAIEEMARTGASIVQQIRAKASTSGDGVYSLASISPPQNGSPIAPPGKPTQFSCALTVIGTLVLKWKCRNPRGAVGTMYHVNRRIGDGPFQYVGCTGERKFVDATVPAGASALIYQVQGMRSTAVGPIGSHIVNFGTTRAGGVVTPAMVVASSKVRVAA